MNDDTVKLVRIPADTWKAVVAALESIAALNEKNQVERAVAGVSLAHASAWAAEDIARRALELARKVSAE